MGIRNQNTSFIHRFDGCAFLPVAYRGAMNTQSGKRLSDSDAIRRLDRNQPYVYRIKVAGTLDPDWSDRLGGLRIEPQSGDTSGQPVTVLEGPLRDQAQLSGVLNTLFDLRHILVGVELMESKESKTC